MKKLFLAHFSGDAAELHELATELRLRGIVPWVDKLGGFAVGDDAETEARRAIRDDCFGVLLYATASVFERPFIRDVEIDEAKQCLTEDSAFLLLAVPRGISFGTLREESLQAFNIDLSLRHTIALPEQCDLHQGLRTVCREVLQTRLHRLVMNQPQALTIQYSTRDLLPNDEGEVLCIDATRVFQSSVQEPDSWTRLICGLQDIKQIIAERYGRPRLRITGSKHLSAAFLFGRVFTRFVLDIRQTPTAWWSTDNSVIVDPPFNVTIHQGSAPFGALYLEVASGYKNIAAGVNSWMAESGQEAAIRLVLRPVSGPLQVDNALCCAMVRQTYTEIERVVQAQQITAIHIFAAAPQSYMMMLGQAFQGMPPVQLYEWDGNEYHPSCFIPSEVL